MYRFLCDTRQESVKCGITFATAAVICCMLRNWNSGTKAVIELNKGNIMLKCNCQSTGRYYVNEWKGKQQKPTLIIFSTLFFTLEQIFIMIQFIDNNKNAEFF